MDVFSKNSIDSGCSLNLINIFINLFSFSFPSKIFNSSNLLLQFLIVSISLFSFIFITISVILSVKSVFIGCTLDKNKKIEFAVSKINPLLENNNISSYI